MRRRQNSDTPDCDEDVVLPLQRRTASRTPPAGTDLHSPPAEVDLDGVQIELNDADSGSCPRYHHLSEFESPTSRLRAPNSGDYSYFDLLNGSESGEDSDANAPPVLLPSAFSDLGSVSDRFGRLPSGGNLCGQQKAAASLRGNTEPVSPYLVEDEDDAVAEVAMAAATAAMALHKQRSPTGNTKRYAQAVRQRPSSNGASLARHNQDTLPVVDSGYFIEDDEDEDASCGSPDKLLYRQNKAQTASPPYAEMIRRCLATGASAVFEEDDEDDAYDTDGTGPTASGGGTSVSRSSVSSRSATSDIRTVEALALGKPTTVIGQGGDRGSQVFRLDPEHVEKMRREQWRRRQGVSARAPAESPEAEDTYRHADIPMLEALVQEAIAYKLYPVPISVNELEFIETSFRLTRLREHILSPKNTDTNRTSTGSRSKKDRLQSRRQSFFKNIGASFRFMPASMYRTDEEKMLYAAHHLVFPGAIVKNEGEKRGLLMPLYDYSLKQFLVKQTNERDALRASRQQAERGPKTASSLLSTMSYGPIRDVNVIAAIAFQVLEGIRLLNHHMPHNATDGSTKTSEVPTYTGFTHNDLHMDNILLSRRGRVAVCDFELVENFPVLIGADGKRKVRDRSRLPPPCRRSPHGVFSESSDVWAFGLLILALLTGVDPLFSNTALVNDFGEGPLLKPSSEARPDESIVDWDANIAPHVEALLHNVDPSGALAADAAPLLEVCAKCLVNANGQKPATATALLRDPVFAPFLESLEEAEAVVGEWVSQFPE